MWEVLSLAKSAERYFGQFGLGDLGWTARQTESRFLKSVANGEVAEAPRSWETFNRNTDLALTYSPEKLPDNELVFGFLMRICKALRGRQHTVQ